MKQEYAIRVADAEGQSYIWPLFSGKEVGREVKRLKSEKGPKTVEIGHCSLDALGKTEYRLAFSQ
jgi:hypothetical protein